MGGDRKEGLGYDYRQLFFDSRRSRVEQVAAAVVVIYGKNRVRKEFPEHTIGWLLKIEWVRSSIEFRMV